MDLPPYGLYLPCRFVRCRDGDTVTISLPQSNREWSVRLIGIDCPELHEQGGPEAKQFAESVLQNASDRLSVYIPAPKDVVNLLANLTFDRIPGHIIVGEDRNLAELLLVAGHATKTA